MRSYLTRRAILLTAIALCSLAIRLPAADDLTVKGVLVDASCLKKEGSAALLSASHVACAKECFAKGEPLGIFDEDVGLVKIVGDFPTKNRAKLLGLLGQRVEARGTRARGGDYTILIDVTTLALAAKK